MATILDDEDTIEAQALSTSLDPYGQLVKMLMPRALCIAIYDRMGVPLWLSDGCDGPDLLQLVEESLTAARADQHDPGEREGFARTWDGETETAYVFILRDGASLLGALAVSVQDSSSSGARPFSLVQGLVRPVLQVLSRELVSQYSVGDTRKDLRVPQEDLELLLDATSVADTSDSSDELEQMLRNCVERLNCAAAALLVPDRKIAISCWASDARRTDADSLEKTQKHLFAWAQVQRRTLMLNKAPPSSPMGALPYKILACPIRHGAEHVAGIIVLFKQMSAADFDIRQVRIIEMMTRRITCVLQNSYDPATGLLTRPAFEQRALATLATAHGDAEHCVAYADVDRLHAVNENHGMHVGDQVIARIAETISANLSPAVTASRISGDRFALFFADHGVDAARPFLDGLCGAISALEFAHEGRRIELSMSFGMAAVPNTKLPLSHALAAAEVACKAAKAHGRARVEAYVEASQQQQQQQPERSAVRRIDDVAIAGNLREAIANDRFRMEAQPVIQLRQQVPARRFELLLRMIDPSGESIAPDKFLSAAERYELATDIDRWVVQYALEILSSAAPTIEALGCHFSINISGQSLGDEQFPAYLEQKLREYALPPGLLSFEITESAAVANIVRAEQLIRRLQDMGHAIALDDFGRGLSSLTYLKSLSVSDLKIDGGLVRDLVGNQRSQAMVTAIVQLAQTIKLRTTAKCVESEAILKSVSQLGVDFAQGFAIGRPRPLEIVLQELLREVSGGSRISDTRRMARLAVSL
jgi:diguanylate cyclase (GGDEF)-like protein